MANRHQMRQCWEFTGNDVLHSEPRPVSQTRVYCMSHLSSELVSSIADRLEVEISPSDVFTSTRHLLYDHVNYKVDNVMVLSVAEEEEVPVYFRIKHIIMYHDMWLLCGRLCFSQRFHRHLHAFSIHFDDRWAVVYPGEQAGYSVHNFFVIDDCSFVSSRYHVPSSVSI